MDVIELIKAVIIGIVEGITEWLPISSTGHMILADEFVKLNVSPAFWEMFLVVIQLGAIIAVIVLFFNKLNPFAPSKGPEGRKKTWILWLKVIVGCIPAAIVGILFDDWFEANFYSAITVAIALAVYGIAFIVIERVKGSGSSEEAINKAQGSSHSRIGRAKIVPLKNSAATPRIVGKHSPEALAARARAAAGEGAVNEELATALQPSHAAQPQKAAKNTDIATVENLGFGRAIAIGLFQCLAIIPGTSRSGSTILGGRILGVSREAAAEFSFFLAIPVMFGWSLLKIVKAFVIDDVTLTTTEWGVFVVGIVVAFVVSILAIKFLMGYIRKHSFEVFGWYRIVLGIVVIIFFAVTGQLHIMQ